jgi:hypothetical protein
MDEVFCYVGDIAGYKNILLSLSPEEQRDRIREFIELIGNATREFGFQDSFINVSDTIFVIAKNSKEELKKLIKFSGYMLENGIKKALPIRGAIDFGVAQIDKENHMIYGKAAAEAYKLAEEQDWIGTCCAENSKDCCDEHENTKKPKLPYISELWDFDLVFVYPVPMKAGEILFRPVVSWNVPSYEDFRTGTVRRGLVSDENMDWKYANRVQNTIIFSQYLNVIKCGLIRAKPEVFRGDLPIRHVNDIINESLSEVRFLNGGWNIIKIPGRDEIRIGPCDGAGLISALTNILVPGSSSGSRVTQSSGQVHKDGG